MKISNLFLHLALAQLFTVCICNAQNTVKLAPANISIDGNAKEWADLTPYSNGTGKIDYAISNDKENLYLIVKTQDVLQQNNILNAGISFSVDVKGKKRTTASITFPQKTGGDLTALKSGQENMLGMIEIAKGKNLKVEGFKDIKEDQITLSNTYNIKIAIDYVDGNLVYEEAIPLKLFNAGEFLDKEWAFNVKINEGFKPLSNNSVETSNNIPNSRAQSYYGPGKISFDSQNPNSGIQSNKTPVVHTIDFWIKSPLKL